jgi:N-acetylmuramoyl-L-alanine amidase
VGKMAKWIQDAGHGGSDPGAVAKGNTEKDYTLEATLYVDKRLGDHGIYSHCTRTKDETWSPNKRTSKAENYDKGNSHHFNAGGGSGVEVIHSIFSDGKYEHMLIEEFKAAGYPVRPKPVYFRKGSNGLDYYYMHRDSGKCRMTIIEYDFVDGPQSEKIKDKAYREGMYECVVRAVCRDEGVDYKPLKKKEPKSESSKPTDKNKMHYVQIGAFSDYKNAEKLAKEAESKGFKVFIKSE